MENPSVKNSVNSVTLPTSIHMAQELYVPLQQEEERKGREDGIPPSPLMFGKSFGFSVALLVEMILCAYWTEWAS